MGPAQGKPQGHRGPIDDSDCASLQRKVHRIRRWREKPSQNPRTRQVIPPFARQIRRTGLNLDSPGDREQAVKMPSCSSKEDSRSLARAGVRESCANPLAACGTFQDAAVRSAFEAAPHSFPSRGAGAGSASCAASLISLVLIRLVLKILDCACGKGAK